MREKSHNTPKTLNVFYSYNVEVIARWCAVSKATAKRYKNGTRKPSPQAIKLFHLHASRKILGEHWQGWLINGDTLVNPEGRAFTQPQLRAYCFIWQLASMYAGSEVAATLRELERQSA